MKTNNFIKHYIRNIKVLFPTLGKKERLYIKGFEETIYDYAEDTPISSMEELINEFGTPQDVVSSYIDQADTEYLQKQIRRSSYIKRGILISLILLLAFIGYYGILIYKDYKTAQKEHIQIEETIIQYGDD